MKSDNDKEGRVEIKEVNGNDRFDGDLCGDQFPPIIDQVDDDIKSIDVSEGSTSKSVGEKSNGYSGNIVGVWKMKFAEIVNTNKIDNKLVEISTEISKNGNEVVILNDEMIELGFEKWKNNICGFFVGWRVNYEKGKDNRNNNSWNGYNMTYNRQRYYETQNKFYSGRENNAKDLEKEDNVEQGNRFEEELNIRNEDSQAEVDKNPHNNNVKAKSCQVLKEYYDAMRDENNLLMQKAKIEWLKDGDRNTEFFHRIIKERIHKGRIMTICNKKGERFENEKVAEQFVKHFEDFLGKKDVVINFPIDKVVFPNKSSSDDVERICRGISDVEVKNAMFDVEDSKALGPNGYTARLKGVLGKLVNESQSAFIAGRQITDNILLAQELFKGYNRKQKIRKFGFPAKMIEWIMVCVSTTKFFININEEREGYFSGGRGLRQGDPMSLYLFTLVMKFFVMDNAGKERKFSVNYVWKDLCTEALKVEWHKILWVIERLIKPAIVDDKPKFLVSNVFSIRYRIKKLMMMGTADEIVKVSEKGPVFVEDRSKEEQVADMISHFNDRFRLFNLELNNLNLTGILLQNLEILGVLQDVAADPTLPCRKAVHCALYGHGEAIFFQSWLVQEQTALGKDKSNPLTVGSLLKTTWSSIHHLLTDEVLTSPEQTATGITERQQEIERREATARSLKDAIKLEDMSMNLRSEAIHHVMLQSLINKINGMLGNKQFLYEDEDDDLDWS
uniref:Uncharacterized protein n=1 Tax=Tanacetum cinerariifolium TaxID=118510 RepID=A0A6L2L4I2_TANCI|nr:hypothetical protein [Tanacetum cinerariifolium]